MFSIDVGTVSGFFSLARTNTRFSFGLLSGAQIADPHKLLPHQISLAGASSTHPCKPTTPREKKPRTLQKSTESWHNIHDRIPAIDSTNHRHHRS